MKLLISVFIMLGSCLCHYSQTPSNAKCQIQELAISAALGDAEAQHDLGVAFHQGVEVTRDYSKAAVMWRLASNAGITSAFNNLGHLTYYGRGVTQDYAEGVRLWRVAAEKGFAESQVHIGTAHLDGRHLERNYVEAYAWAKTGRHYAEKMQDVQMGKSIIEMADKRLIEARVKLSKSQLAEADKKAAEYIVKYVPK
jgi:TPR repeat protein